MQSYDSDTWSHNFPALPLVINRPPKVVALAVDLHENLVQMPLPIRIGSHSTDPFPADFSGKHRANSIPPVPHSFVADADAALVQQVLDIPKRKWKAKVESESTAYPLGE